jgi:hypothetical protein
MMWICSALRGARPAIEETVMPHPAPAALLASSLLALAFPAHALESVTTSDAEAHPRAEQRQLLEAYVECLEASAATGDAVVAATAAVCPRERGAYRATLPDERAEEILRALDVGAGARR